MKKILLYVLILGLSTTAFCSIVTTNLYKNYTKATEKLLEEIEIMCDYHNLDWGDTICEGDAWCNYVEACEKIRIIK
jgi:hypothetical protein